MILLLLFAFAAGIVTILSPCILPVLPIVLSGSVGSGHRRPWGIVIGFVAGFTFFTLFLTAIVNAFGVSPDGLRSVAVFAILLFGISLLVPQLQALMEQSISALASRVPRASGEGFRSGILIGLSLGLIWTPCVGPILASVISLALTGTVTGSAFFITLAYSIGTAVPMLAIMYGGRKLIARVPGLMQHTATIQKIFGVLMILTAVAIYFNVDRKFQSSVLDTFPAYGTGLTSFEANPAVTDQLKQLDVAQKRSAISDDAQGVVAPELIPGGEWLNSKPLTLAELRGKQVVLLDFMTYTCINCIRTFPYLVAWHQKYASEGLTIIGIHTPEFEFEKNPENVRRALSDFGITFPVMQDNDYATWQAYGNRFWPRKYLIDIHGRIVYDHIGEGKYPETEQRIQEALAERARYLGEEASLGSGVGRLSLDKEMQIGDVESPETYFGSARNENLGNGQAGVSGRQTFVLPERIELNTLYLGGAWDLVDEFAQTASSGARVVFKYHAQNVFIVAGAERDLVMRVLIDGKPVGVRAGTDVSPDGTVTINEERLYHLIGGETSETHTLELIIDSSGLQAFTLTFG